MDVSPRYTIHRYSEDIFKVVAFKGVRDSGFVKLRDMEEDQHYDAKLNEAFCRAKSMVLQYALCNEWDYFFTGTLDRIKFNRYDLDSFQKRLSQFIRDKRKAYGTQLSFLLVPEQHKNGAWHMHGLISGIPASALRRFRPPEPQKLVHSDYFNWPDYMQKFGFCSLGPIRHPVATSFYISKYVSKELSRRGGALGKHLYFHSRPLNKAVHVSNVYSYNAGLDAVCVHDHEFCKTGMVLSAPWYFPYAWEDVALCNELEPLTSASYLEPEPDFSPSEIDPFYEQISIDGF